MNKIAVAGAGVGGVVCAYYLAKNGYDVVVYERNDYDHLTYEWHDDIALDAFDAIGLGMPPADLYYPKRNWTFVPPNSERHIYADLQAATDISVERRGFLHWLIGLAEQEGVRFVYNTEVALWQEDGAVRGLKVGDSNIPYALVVDNCGADSPLRLALPPEAGIQEATGADEVFCAYRAFYNRTEGVEVDDHETNRVYLLHMGGQGISWCLADPTRADVDVLIGRLGKLDMDTVRMLMAPLSDDNPILGRNLLSGGRICRIPIRRPLDMMVADGYAALGDSAFMTIPLLGSGMAAGMLAGRILAETVAEHQSVSRQALWHYQVRYYQACGAEHCGVDEMKRWLLSADPADVRWLFESGVLTNDNINAGAAGRNIHLSFSELVQKAIKGRRRLGLLLKLSGLLARCNKAVKVAGAIPKVYNERRIADWRKRLAKLYKPVECKVK